MTQYVATSGKSEELRLAHSSQSSSTELPMSDERPQSFFRRYRMPILLGIIAVCLYLGSILYILYGRGQVA